MPFNIKIQVGPNSALSVVSANGSESHTITDTEANSFGLNPSAINNAVNAYFGQTPDNAYLHDPTPWNNLYQTYGWAPVTTNCILQSATITGVTSVPQIVATKSYSNNLGTSDLTCSADLTQDVTNSIGSNWSNSQSLSVTSGISVEAEGIGASLQIGYTDTWGTGGDTTQSVQVGSSSGVSFVLNPGQSAVADLMATLGTVTIQVTYQAYLTGNIAVNYGSTFKGHHFWALAVAGVMGAASLSNMITVTQNITVQLYSDSNITVKNTAGGSVMMAHPTSAVAV